MAHDLETCKRIVVDRFPELKDVEISVAYKKLKTCHGQACRIRRDTFEITIDKAAGKASKDVLIGILAHEIAHVALWTRPAIIRLFAFVISRLFQPSKNEERSADMLAVDRGFGKELLALTRYHNSQYEDYTSDEGLTEREILALIKKSK